MVFVLLGCGMVLAAIGITEAVRGWAAGDSGLGQGLGGIIAAIVGSVIAGTAALRLLA